MAIAFALIGTRVPGRRRDLGLAALFVVTASVTFMQFGMVVAGTVVWARLYVAGVYVVHGAAIVIIYVVYGRDVLAGARRRHAAAATAGFALVCAAIAGFILSGIADRGVMMIDVFGIRVPMLRGGPAVVVVDLVVLIATEVFGFWMLTRPGPGRTERLLLAVPIALSPLPVIHEQLVTLGWISSPPLGGYFLALVGLVGAWILADRVRSLSTEPRKFAGYEVVRKLGAGGLAVVWLAARRGTGEMGSVTQLVALKRLRPELAEDPRFVRMFLEEARLAARLRHPNIVSLLEAGSTDQGVYLAMELVEGPSLARIIQHQLDSGEQPPVVAAIEAGAQLADALAYAHDLTLDGKRLEVVHRDVSPHNVLVSRSGHVKLTDFGIARSIEQTSHTQTGVIKGKIRYLAPEQIRGETYDQRVDVYALGVVLLELAVGRYRFPGQTDVQVLYQVLEGKQDEPAMAAVTGELAAVLRRAIDPDPAKRTPTAAALLAALAPLRRPAEGVAALAKLASAVPDVAGAEPSSLPFEETQVAEKTSGAARSARDA